MLSNIMRSSHALFGVLVGLLLVTASLQQPTATCNPEAVESNSVNLPSTIDTPTYVNGVYSIAIDLPFQETDPAATNHVTSTEIGWMEETATSCDYSSVPGQSGVDNAVTFLDHAETGVCVDRYAASYNWATLKACGDWTSTSVVVGEGETDEVWTSRVYITRNYTVTQGRVTTESSVGTWHDLSVSFPLTRVVTKEVFLTASPDLQNNMAIKTVVYDSVANHWVVTLLSNVLYPHQLVPASDVPVISSLGPDQVATATVSSCAFIGATDPECQQLITMVFTTGCDQLDYESASVIIAANTIQYQCQASAISSGACTLDPVSSTPYVSTTTATVSISQLATLSECPTTTVDIQEPTATLSFNQADFATSALYFAVGTPINVKLLITPSGSGNTDTVSKVEVQSISEQTMGDLTATPSVTTSGGFLVLNTAPAACNAGSHPDTACFSVATDVGLFVGVVSDSGTIELSFKVAYTVTFTQDSGTKREVTAYQQFTATNSYSLSRTASGNIPLLVRSPQAPIYSSDSAMNAAPAVLICFALLLIAALL